MNFDGEVLGRAGGDDCECKCEVNGFHVGSDARLVRTNVKPELNLRKKSAAPSGEPSQASQARVGSCRLRLE